MKTKQLLIACIACLSTSAWAIEPGPSSTAQQGTESWMQLQIRGVVASTNLQTVSAAEREMAMQRWLNSFNYPIPEFFDQDSGGEIGSSK
ncbi:DUF3613 domain-containing protein [Pseudomonas mediterranea]|uniref:DUF3613 domain-containing protein n=1 Tax=Pseudomonas mediterranea TaxID=183795 RepID=A0AAX2DAN3_9PSED|nr:DUF3613 domain-containing protein [Pseudomonas mediterranea]KGU86961.1 hypothetical protein N005_02360 [Pseudomonas mediterranea CFBP 5447]MBL0844433.1 DUF3613 domain-containing protein [Pseudomonas mediterranea]UZD99553.1 DUF3613 domain-containing protein [Pseudomonas mediterranea]CAH0220272.1 hypothetical protein SRABI112_02357 [Pseudomonas mediterranea]SDU45679.1 Protein of unknown function [Pseudomonas mediterranea]